MARIFSLAGFDLSGGLDQAPAPKVARLELPLSGTTIAANTPISLAGPNNGMGFEGASDISLGASPQDFAARYPASVRVWIAGELADESNLAWVSGSEFSYSLALWPGADIVAQEG